MLDQIARELELMQESGRTPGNIFLSREDWSQITLTHFSRSDPFPDRLFGIPVRTGATAKDAWASHFAEQFMRAGGMQNFRISDDPSRPIVYAETFSYLRVGPRNSERWPIRAALEDGISEGGARELLAAGVRRKLLDEFSRLRVRGAFMDMEFVPHPQLSAYTYDPISSLDLEGAARSRHTYENAWRSIAVEGVRAPNSVDWVRSSWTTGLNNITSTNGINPNVDVDALRQYINADAERRTAANMRRLAEAVAEEQRPQRTTEERPAAQDRVEPNRPYYVRNRF